MVWVVFLLFTTIGSELLVPQIIQKYGYPVEVFENIATEDKYLLTLFRIPHGKNNTGSSKKPALLLMHGLFRTSFDYVIPGPERGLAYLFADRGYDVWLGNVRGTMYSKKHMTLNANNPKYWQFSWDEMGAYDLPAFIDKIKNVTGQKQITYVGLSQGTTIFYILASQRPKYNADISVMVALAPVAYMKHFAASLIIILTQFDDLINALVQLTGTYEFPPRPINNLLNGILRQICRPDHKYFEVCTQLGFLMAGYSPEQFDKMRFHEYVGDGISAVAARQLLHYAQSINSSDFRRYNFGTATNLKVYGSASPPVYNISKITTPVALFYSSGDVLSQPKDAERLCQELQNCVYNYKVPKQFNHFDFLHGLDVVPLVYERVYQVLDQYKSN